MKYLAVAKDTLEALAATMQKVRFENVDLGLIKQNIRDLLAVGGIAEHFEVEKHIDDLSADISSEVEQAALAKWGIPYEDLGDIRSGKLKAITLAVFAVTDRRNGR